MTEPGKAENSNVIAILNQLVVTCKDGEKGFRAASLGVADSELATLFLNYSEQRAGFAAELLTEVRRLGGNPETGDDDAPVAKQRGWTGIEAAVEAKLENAIIAEAERSENQAVEEYCEALEGNLPTAVQVVVENHYIHVRDAHDHVRALERLHQERSATRDS
ncbi:MAG TPA: PA2169 family four-helix-bundle protein [Gemmatimonadales bacterium]|nr:PA2169 family four-helix-bundle protein [Gemmatimonadales bacterium]